MKRIGALAVLITALGWGGVAQARAHHRHLGVQHGSAAITRAVADWLPGSKPFVSGCWRLGSAAIRCTVKETGYSHFVLGYDPARSGSLRYLYATRIARHEIYVEARSWVFGTGTVRG